MVKRYLQRFPGNFIGWFKKVYIFFIFDVKICYNVDKEYGWNIIVFGLREGHFFFNVCSMLIEFVAVRKR